MRNGLELNQGLPANLAARDRWFRSCADASVTDRSLGASLVPSPAFSICNDCKNYSDRDRREPAADNSPSSSDPDRVGQSDACILKR
jgi:hypothetical protein